MKPLRDLNDKMAPMFQKGGKFERLYPLFEAHDTGSFTPGIVTKTASHVRDALDQKRMMIAVVFALLPCFLMAMFNTGYQANAAIASGATPLDDWHGSLYQLIGFSFAAKGSAVSFFSLSNFVLGAIFFLPVYIVKLAAGGLSEVAICIIRKHPITEGFLVTSALFPLILPATIPLWQVALGIIFGVVIGKEIFGGVGMNILNPALTARAFLFFAYPAEISGDGPWLPYDTKLTFAEAGTQISSLPDASSGATYLSLMASGNVSDYSTEFALGGAKWMDAFYGMVPGSMGETSVLACLLGAVLLISMKIASWRTMLGIVIGTAGTALLLNAIGSDTNPMFNVPFYWHFVVGGWAFGAVFMATDPVSSPFTETGKFIYGLLIGFMVILVRCINPAYAEGMMLAILFMNMFAPLIDHFVVEKNIKRRLNRDVA
ncbi:MAG: NADH:ubiquinone reductase (Na(+)-transporting) subunit B [Myxococcota bacterium]|nr:NADH:ubiquinone reductase (Na(+)-transporting) subunit B [Myxococcota bacterium]